MMLLPREVIELQSAGEVPLLFRAQIELEAIKIQRANVGAKSGFVCKSCHSPSVNSKSLVIDRDMFMRELTKDILKNY